MARTQRRGRLTAAVAAALSVGMLSPAVVGLTGSSADAKACYDVSTKYKTAKGQAVWIPTNVAAGAYQRGGTQSLAVSDGKQVAKMKGSAKSVGGSAGVGISIVSASASFDKTWNESTTSTTSKSRTYTTTSPQLPAKKLTRWTMYHRGHQFKTTVTVIYSSAACGVKKHSWMVVVPDASWAAAKQVWMVQYRSSASQLR